MISILVSARGHAAAPGAPRGEALLSVRLARAVAKCQRRRCWAYYDAAGWYLLWGCAIDPDGKRCDRCGGPVKKIEQGA